MRPASFHGKMLKRIAAIDIGTNSFRLLVAEFTPKTGKLKTLAKEREVLRLASSSTDMKLITEEAMRAGIEVLIKFKNIAAMFSAKIRAAATSSVREALNREEFIRKAREEAGIDIEVISGHEEARLIYLGVLQALSVYNKRVLLVDIGGGSTEFLCGSRGTVHFAESLKLGAIRLTEKYFKQGIFTPKSLKECRAFALGVLSPVIREAKNEKYDIFIGTAGTIRTVTGILQKKEWTDPGSLNGRTLSRNQLFLLSERLSLLGKADEIAGLTGVEPKRAGILMAGVIILETIFRQLDIRDMTYSEYSLKEGLAVDTLEKKHPVKSGIIPALLRQKSVSELSDRYNNDSQHSAHVAFLALQIFDQTKQLHGLNGLHREYLKHASLLHDIGFFVSHSMHHRHTYYLIKNSDLPGFTEDEKEIIANTARYHRKSHPKAGHPEFVVLSESEQLTVRKLASILRLADGLDRSHASFVGSVEIITVGGKYSLSASSSSSSSGSGLNIEIWGAERKKALFEETFGVSITVKQVKSIAKQQKG